MGSLQGSLSLNVRRTEGQTPPASCTQVIEGTDAGPASDAKGWLFGVAMGALVNTWERKLQMSSYPTVMEEEIRCQLDAQE